METASIKEELEDNNISDGEIVDDTIIPLKKKKSSKKIAKQFSCYFCNKSFPRLSYLQDHRLEEHVDENGIHSCPHCDEKRPSYRLVLKPNYFKKQRSSSSFLLT